MDEKQKMLKGLLYNAEDEFLKTDRILCKLLCQKYNQVEYNKFEERDSLIRKIISTARETILIEQPFICEYGFNIELGYNFHSQHNLIIIDCAKVTFGNNVVVGPNCGFYTAQYPLDAQTRNQNYQYAKPITVGNDVCFGANVTVMAGVTIGDNTVIEAGSVVTSDIPPNVIAKGNPCKIVK